MLSSIQRWNWNTHEYEPYHPDPEWRVTTYSDNMDEPINCANCGKGMTFGEGYTSQELHSHVGFGFAVCETCYEAESERRREG